MTPLTPSHCEPDSPAERKSLQVHRLTDFAFHLPIETLDLGDGPKSYVREDLHRKQQVFRGALANAMSDEDAQALQLLSDTELTDAAFDVHFAASYMTPEQAAPMYLHHVRSLVQSALQSRAA